MRSAVVASSRRHPKAGVARILGVRNSKSSVHTSLCQQLISRRRHLLRADSRGYEVAGYLQFLHDKQLRNSLTYLGLTTEP